MTREELAGEITCIFRETFDDDSIVLSDETVASDVDGWDSLMHIDLIFAIESKMGIKFPMRDVVGMKNVGQLIDRVAELSGLRLEGVH